MNPRLSSFFPAFPPSLLPSFLPNSVFLVRYFPIVIRREVLSREIKRKLTVKERTSRGKKRRTVLDWAWWALNDAYVRSALWASQAARASCCRREGHTPCCTSGCFLTASALHLNSVLLLLLNTWKDNNKLTNIFMEYNIFITHFKYFISADTTILKDRHMGIQSPF